MKSKFIILMVLMTGVTLEVLGQETIFMLFKKDVALADQYYAQNNYSGALNLYNQISDKNSSPEIGVKIARSHFFLKQYALAADAYSLISADSEAMTPEDLYFAGESYIHLGEYDEANRYFRKYLEHDPDNALIQQKIWRINNISYLYEDSLHYEIRYAPFNSEYGEICATSYKNGIVFTSNRKEIGLIDHIDASRNTPFYKLYTAEALEDTLWENATQQYAEPELLNINFNNKLHIGPATFYDGDTKMVFAASGKKDSKTLRLYFGEEQNGEWQVTGEFPFNSEAHSISEPSINQDGNLLYFSSDMAGGMGGKDLYRSIKKDGQWLEPENLGNMINTPYDEVYPYIHHNNVLYFSSNGHAGLGGLDIFKIRINDLDRAEIENLGYPINSNNDDFGIVIDSMNIKGFLSSNRHRGGYKDDIYEFDMDIQPYPLQISGQIKYKEQNWLDSSKLSILPNAKLQLYDNIKDVILEEVVADDNGNFTFTVPYFSKYKVQVISGIIGEGVVSFEVPKHRTTMGTYEIVVVKDDFKSTESNSGLE